ncbi:MAG TPA: CobD/CbiB family cobalamin biosynthesis protein, partial [Geminicoccaceae bacterium]|nr:CobD/CbiB family cobalamin biosynthesis protein [Geminicoccaceae bacterium]
MIVGADPAALLMALLLALAVDAAFGEPAALYRRVPHPVVLIGRLVNTLERRWFPEAGGPTARARAGVAVSLAVIAAAVAAGLALHALARALPAGGWVLEGLLMSALIAQRSLYDHVARVAAGLERGLEEGRAAVAHVVGRDPRSLDAHGVARAAIESTAENFSDGVVAPVFWALLLGPPGLAAYKAVNTLDSMIGHRSPRYLHFGRFAARLDDAANLVPARLGGALLVLAACLLPGA